MRSDFGSFLLARDSPEIANVDFRAGVVRTPRVVPIELLRLDESQLHLRTLTENVSPRSVHVVTDWNRAPGKHVLLTPPEQGVKSLARVVYCQPVESSKFAVGLQLVARVEEWGKPASRD